MALLNCASVAYPEILLISDYDLPLY
jgi:hypothetical protein